MPDPAAEAFAKNLAATSPEPIGMAVDRAEGPYVWDTQGRRYLDLLSGIGVANIGHTHPRVVEAVRAQAERHHHVMVYGEYIQENQALYARELAAQAPGGIDRVYFVNSGAEAIEGAMKLARKATGRPGFACFEGAYHGDTLGALSLNPNAIYRRGFEPLLGPLEILPFNDSSALGAITEATAAVVIEPVQGEGGVRIPSAEFMGALAERCAQTGALLIADEVMTGFGRTGQLWAVDHWELVPDILVSAKALGGGFPLGAFMAESSLMETLADDPPLSHVTTFGGHPVSCAAGRAALSVLNEESLARRAADVGAWWRDLLAEKLSGCPRVAEVRGLGMVVGIETIGPGVAREASVRARSKKLLVGWTLHHDHILRLLPPLITPREELARAAEELAACLG